MSSEKLELYLDELTKHVIAPFWERPDFWVATTIGVAGLILSALAFLEARQAKRAAVAAGRTVKVQTVAIELSEVSQRLDGIEPEISFTRARDLLAEITRKLRRVSSPFADDPLLRDAIVALHDALDVAKQSLTSVRPTSVHSSDEAPQAVYYGIEADFSNINNLIADLIGLLEKGTMGLEHKNGN